MIERCRCCLPPLPTNIIETAAHGPNNMLEPALYKKCVLCGEYTAVSVVNKTICEVVKVVEDRAG